MIDDFKIQFALKKTLENISQFSVSVKKKNQIYYFLGFFILNFSLRIQQTERQCKSYCIAFLFTFFFIKGNRTVIVCE